MINTFEQYLNEVKQKPLYTIPSEVSKKAGSAFDSVASGASNKTVIKFDSTVIEDRGDIVYMFANKKPIMTAYKSGSGAQTEFCFINATAVDRCEGWNVYNGREFNIIYSNGKPYAVVAGGIPTWVELSKTKWYSEGDLTDICSG